MQLRSWIAGGLGLAIFVGLLALLTAGVGAFTYAPPTITHHGSGEPPRWLGLNGDYYHDDVNNTLFGPKVGKDWGSGVPQPIVPLNTVGLFLLPVAAFVGPFGIMALTSRLLELYSDAPLPEP